MILEVASHSREIKFDRDASSIKDSLGANATKLQYVGGVDAAGSQDDFFVGIELQHTVRSQVSGLHTRRFHSLVIAEQNLGDLVLGEQDQVLAA